MKLIIDIPDKVYNEYREGVMSMENDCIIGNAVFDGIPYEETQGELKEYKPLELDYNVKSAVENLKTAYWSNDYEKYAKDFTEAEEIIVSAICHDEYIVCKRPQGDWITVYFSREELNVPQKASMFDFVKCPFCETIHQGRHNFCSWCGADMRGEK